MAAHAVEPRQEFAAAIEARGFRQIGAMASAAGSLDVLDGQNGLLPGKGGLMRVAHFRRQALAAMADYTPPVACPMRNGWMGAEGLRHG